MYFITTKRMLEVCFFQHTPTFIIEPKKNESCLKTAPKNHKIKLYYDVRRRAISFPAAKITTGRT